MDLRHLGDFLELARSGNFSAKQTAAQTPSTTGAITAAAVNHKVRQTAEINRSSCSIFK